MNPTTEALARKNRTLLRYQVLLTALAVLIWWLLRGSDAAIAAGYGGAVTIIATLLLGWRMLRAGRETRLDPRKSMQILYVGAAWRFLLTVALFAFGIGYFKLDPPAMIVGFMLAQLAYIFVGLGTQRASD